MSANGSRALVLHGTKRYIYPNPTGMNYRTRALPNSVERFPLDHCVMYTCMSELYCGIE